MRHLPRQCAPQQRVRAPVLLLLLLPLVAMLMAPRLCWARALAEGNPTTSPSRVATVMLLGGDRSEAQARACLTSYKTQVWPSSPSEIILFHEGNYDDNQKQNQLLKDIFTADDKVKFITLPSKAWAVPHTAEGIEWPALDSPWGRTVGYRHMCRWFSNLMMLHLHRMGFKYVMRLDADSTFTSPAQGNMFTYMRDHGIKYAYRSADKEDQFFTKAFPELVQYFATAHINRLDLSNLKLHSVPRGDIKGLNSHGGWSGQIIYNNFFMLDVQWWVETHLVQRFLRLVDHAAGIYQYRWGDAPIHTMVVLMFLKKNETHAFNFGYIHPPQSYDTSRVVELEMASGG